MFVVGMEENLFPSIQSITSRADLEEERRLFYVAITRARKQAILSYAENRYRWGNLTSCEPSRFLEAIAERYLDLPHKPAHRSSSFGGGFHKPSKFTNSRLTTNTAKKSDAQPRMEHFESSPVEDIQAGMQVLHAQFGQGKVLSIEGTGGNRKAVVFFAAIGQKNLQLKFAREKIVE